MKAIVKIPIKKDGKIYGIGEKIELSEDEAVKLKDSVEIDNNVEEIKKKKKDDDNA
jgi:hypothetical protein